MNNLKRIFSFKTVYSENKTFLVFSIGKKEEINYSQVQMLESDTFKNYFLPFQCTKTANTSKISFDISGLTSLSEYLKTEIKQDQYFEMISGIQKIVSCCQKSYLSYDNLICDPRYMYYHNTLKKILMIYIPLKNPHYICDNIPKCLKKLHSNAKSVIITDGNIMNKYEDYLAQFVNPANKKDADAFTPDSLLRFFKVNNIAHNNYNSFDSVSYENVPAQNDFFINDQQMQSSYAQTEADTPQDYSATVVRSRRNEVFLTDQSGNRYNLYSFPFTIGRSRDKDLIISQNTVSGNHAVITSEDGKYFIKDHSSNGTYLNDENNRISYSEINNGDKLYFDRFCYQFSVVKNDSDEDESSSRTVMVSRRSRPAKALAYLKRVEDNYQIRIMQYPFQDEAIPGATIYTETVKNRTAVFVENASCGSLVFENTLIARGTNVEIFSGCTLFIDCIKYTFIIEN